MNNASSLSTLILGIALVVSAYFVASSVKSFGQSLERAASNLRPTDVPSRLELDVDLGGRPLRIESKNMNS